MRRLLVPLLLAPLVLLVANPAAGAPVNLAANGGFEYARYSDHSVVWGWTCDSGTSQQGSALTGAHSLAATPTTTTTGRCSQLVPVQPGQAYTLTAWVRGGYAFLGHDQGLIWTPPTTQWTQLTTSFTANSDQVQIYVHGWYANGAIEVDNVVLSGVDSAVRRPVPPSHLVPQETTSHSQKLTWLGSPGATAYRVYRDGQLVQSTAATSTVVDGLTPATTYQYQVMAVDRAGESGPSETVEARTQQRYDEVPYQVRSVVGTPGANSAWLAWEAVMTATDGYRVYQDGVLVAWSYGPAFQVTGLRHGTLYTFEVTGLNSAGESVKSRPIQVYTWQVPG